MSEKMIIASRRLVFDLQSGLLARLEAHIFCFETYIFETQALLRRIVISISSAKYHARLLPVSFISEQEVTNYEPNDDTHATFLTSIESTL